MACSLPNLLDQNNHDQTSPFVLGCNVRKAKERRKGEILQKKKRPARAKSPQTIIRHVSGGGTKGNTKGFVRKSTTGASTAGGAFGWKSELSERIKVLPHRPNKLCPASYAWWTCLGVPGKGGCGCESSVGRHDLDLSWQCLLELKLEKNLRKLLVRE